MLVEELILPGRQCDLTSLLSRKSKGWSKCLMQKNIQDVEGETRQLRRQPYAHRPPTVDEVQEHLCTYLSRTGVGANTVWLDGESAPNIDGTLGEDSVEVATVAVDYCFLRDTPVKGALVEWTAKQVVRDFERLGHQKKLYITSDMSWQYGPTAGRRNSINQSRRTLSEMTSFEPR